MPNRSEEKVVLQTCPICSGSITFWRNKVSKGEKYSINLCHDCGFCFVNPRPSMVFLEDFYATSGHTHDIQEKNLPDLSVVLAREQVEPNSSIDAKRMIGTIHELINQDGHNTLLDVGCGFGFFSRQALDEKFQVTAIETADNERKVAKQMTGLEPLPLLFEDYTAPDGSTKVVLMSQILEHALDVNEWMDKVHTLLIKDGIVAIALPNYNSIFRRLMQEKEPYICPPAHLNFFSSQSLSTLLEKHGFVVEAVQWVSRMPKSSFDKRLPSFAKFLLPLIHFSANMVLKLIDAVGMGTMINVYARKVGSTS